MIPGRFQLSSLTAIRSVSSAVYPGRARNVPRDGKGRSMRAQWTTLVFSLLIGVASSATADTNWKTFPGTSCQTNSSNAFYDGFGGLCNESRREDMSITCAVTRDYSISKFPIELMVSGRSGNPDQDMTCVFRNLRLNAEDSGESMAAFFAEMEPIESNAATTIRTRGPVTNLKSDIPAEDFGAHVLVCTLPASRFVKDRVQVTSCLYNYSVREWDGQ